ncbi:ferredoxin [Streptomyces spinoverrucosus]|uniref:ferredoxin n=1 Tax=Streptomyces spinoverrucosus TaxID=284043 RepID=UPI0018C41A37|nr:ferredoxin [Streptomyces spinoverrucosus]MBG0856950.1 ferredoxin [Streptomyces spinoverrucosus]
MSKKILSIDTAVCTGAGTCEAMHPQLFRVSAEGYAVALKTELVEPEAIEAASSVLDVCPTEAIRLASAESQSDGDA